MRDTTILLIYCTVFQFDQCLFNMVVDFVEMIDVLLC